jgi:hypothetical protein
MILYICSVIFITSSLDNGLDVFEHGGLKNVLATVTSLSFLVLLGFHLTISVVGTLS